MHDQAAQRPSHPSRPPLIKFGLGGLLAVAVIALTFSRIAGGSAPLRVAEGPSEIRGLTLRYALPDGDYIERHFVSDTQADWKLLSGSHRGDQGSEAVVINAIAPGIYFVNAVDPQSGTTLSEVFDLSTRRVSSFATRPNPEDPLRRLDKFDSVKLEIIGSDRGSGAATRTS